VISEGRTLSPARETRKENILAAFRHHSWDQEGKCFAMTRYHQEVKQEKAGTVTY